MSCHFLQDLAESHRSRHLQGSAQRTEVPTLQNPNRGWQGWNFHQGWKGLNRHYPHPRGSARRTAEKSLLTLTLTLTLTLDWPG